MLRWLRIARLAAHLARGLCTTTFCFPRMGVAMRRDAIRRWSGQLIAILGVEVRATNASAVDVQPALPPRTVLITNHISWLDMFVVMATHPAVFVAKLEIRGWPLLGRLCADVGTIFIERSSRSALRHINAAVRQALADGELVGVFPEGTTNDGLHLGRFHAALFQSAIDAEATLLPLALRYVNADGSHCGATDFLGETTFVQSLWSVTGAPRIVAVLDWLPPVSCTEHNRRELAHETHAAIAEALGIAQVSDNAQ